MGVVETELRAQNRFNHSRLTSQNDLRDLYDRLMSTRILAFMHYEEDIHVRSKPYEANSYRHDLDLLITSH